MGINCFVFFTVYMKLKVNAEKWIVMRVIILAIIYVFAINKHKESSLL